MRDLSLLLAFNRGIMSEAALARIDLKRTALSASMQRNWMPRTMGPMSLRAGLQYLGTTLDSAAAVYIPFVFSTDDTALLEATPGNLTIWVDDVVVSRPAVSSAVTNGGFGSDLTGWTDSDEAGCISGWVTGGYMSLTGTGEAYARRDQEVTVAAGDQGVEHGLHISVALGKVVVTVGSTAGGVDYLDEVTLYPGVHSLAFTPTGNFYVRLASLTTFASLVDSIAIDAAGRLSLETPWTTAADLPNLRWAQSGDVVYVCDGAHQPQRIERRGSRSWSVAQYRPEDGPFRAENITPTKLTPTALSGNTTLTASRPVFKDGHEGALFRIASNGQTVTRTFTGDDQWTDPIRVVGVRDSRKYTLTIADLSDSTITRQRSIGDVGDWTTNGTFTSNSVTTIDDGLDNQIVYYRYGIAVGDYGTDNPVVTLEYSGGSIEGVCRVLSVTSETVANVNVLKTFGGLDPSSNWWEGRWSDYRGWPSSVAFHDGRLWWAGKDRIDGSVSDAYASFDDTVEGDSGPINRSIGSGPVDTINWILPLSQLLFGAQGSELTARASSLDEPLTPTAFSLRPISTQGSARVPAVTVDTSGVFVQRNGFRVMEASLGESQYTYATHDLTATVPDIGSPGVVRLGVQRQPDTRIHCVRSDGSVAVLVYDRAENVACWVEVSTDGYVEDVVVLPGDDEDAVYYLVNRAIGGTAYRYLERWALESECVGGSVNKLADSSLSFAGPLTTVTGLDHLEGETVVAWGNGKDLGTYTVASGEITLSEAATYITVGLPYTAQFRSARFILESKYDIVTLTHPRQITHVGLVLRNTHAQGLRYGQDFDNLDDLPLIEADTAVDGDYIWTAYEADSVEVNGSWGTDTRLCLEASAPRPCTVVACVVDISGQSK